MQLRASPSPDTAALAVSRFFQVLADPTRLRVLDLLLTGEKHVGELVATLGLQQGRVSSHLACLRWCGFVTTRRAGKRVYYTLVGPCIAELLHLAHQMLADQSDAIIRCVCCTPHPEDLR